METRPVKALSYGLAAVALLVGLVACAGGASLVSGDSPEDGEPRREDLGYESDEAESFESDPEYQGDFESESDDGDERDLSLEELLTTEIVSASRRTERLVDAAAAIYVVTQQDIHRSGATSIPEALRMVPGLHVARQNGNTWAISARGFGGVFATKLLVLIDGRSVYTPMFSGVYWDAVDVVLEDVERIEVVRGPGGALWGANAVNGVINIITKSAADTQGALVTGGVGTEERVFGTARYGAKVGDATWFRVFAKYFDRDGQRALAGGEGDDGWDGARVGFRLDSDLSEESALTVQGDAYRNDLDGMDQIPSFTPPFTERVQSTDHVVGGSLTGRLQLSADDESQTVVQAYYEGVSRERFVTRSRHTLDLDVQHAFAPMDNHRLMAGFGYRYHEMRLEPSPTLSAADTHRGDNLWSLFLNDQIDFFDDRLSLSLGVKVEHNDYTGYEIQPDARLRFRLDERHTVWGAVSRAVRMPSWLDHQGRVTMATAPGNGGPNQEYVLIGNDSFQSEDVLALDGGYRFQLDDRLSLDVAGFYNWYEDLSQFQQGTPFFDNRGGTPRVVVPFHYVNGGSARTFGGELAATWRVNERLRLAGAYTGLGYDKRPQPSPLNGTDPSQSSPTHQGSLRVSWDVVEQVALDVSASYTDNLRRGPTPSFVRVDARLGWRPTASTELEVVGQNLLDPSHPEFPAEFWPVSSELQRGVYVQFTQTF